MARLFHGLSKDITPLVASVIYGASDVNSDRLNAIKRWQYAFVFIFHTSIELKTYVRILVCTQTSLFEVGLNTNVFTNSLKSHT